MSVKKMLTFIAAIVCFAAALSIAHAGNVSELISHRMSEVASNGVVSTKTEDIIAENPELVLAELKQYESSANVNVRWHAYAIGWDIGRKSSDLRIRQEVVARLTNACLDKDPLIWQSISEFLLCFAPEDFNEEARQVIRKLMASESPSVRFIALCGTAELKDQIGRLQKIAGNKDEYGEITTGTAWFAHLALARMGCKEDIAFCIKAFKLEQNISRKMGVLLNDLMYTRQQEVVPILVDYLDNYTRLPAVDKSFPGTPCNQYAAHALSLTIEDFPVKYSSALSYSEEELNVAREWMRIQDKVQFRRSLTNRPNLW